ASCLGERPAVRDQERQDGSRCRSQGRSASLDARQDRVKLPFFTIGHSNRSLEEFIELLRSADVSLLADIRKFPRSRANPQFNVDTLGESLAPFGISYESMSS